VKGHPPDPSAIIGEMGPTRLLGSWRTLPARVAYILVAQSLYWIAVVWRRLLFRTRFVAITGSHGKTTAKELLAAILASSAPTLKSTRNQNTGLALTRGVLRARPWHRFAVIEVAVGGPGEMHRLARLVRPDLAIVLSVLGSHMRTFRTLEAHAAEKAILLQHLRRGGAAVLNADDPRVAAMAGSVRGTVLRCGSSPAFDAWADAVAARWPARLEFDLHIRGAQSCHVRTRLVGRHWCTSVTAALAAAWHLGVPPQQAAAAVASVDPFAGRLQPVVLPSGAVVLRDEYDGSFDTFAPGVAIMADARAGRRVAVISDVSDFGNTMKRRRIARLAREIAGVAEAAVFVGTDAKYGERAAIASGLAAENVHAFTVLREAAEFLRTELRAGDLVFLKGRVSDHLARVFFAQLGPIRCWISHCHKVIECDFCPELGLAPHDRMRAGTCAPSWDGSPKSQHPEP